TADAEAVQRRIHGLTPWPGVTVTWHDDQGETARLKLLRVDALPHLDHDGRPGDVLDDQGHVACGGGAIKILELQPPGKPAMDIDAFLNGHDLGPGHRLEGGRPAPGE
ncbi:MAG: hypothetical protein R3336_04795, partial [Phycisphaeraceae bacterium]|nr:hypothetical protein [Phycisphaeraceae bacterium]